MRLIAGASIGASGGFPTSMLWSRITPSSLSTIRATPDSQFTASIYRDLLTANPVMCAGVACVDLGTGDTGHRRRVARARHRRRAHDLESARRSGAGDDGRHAARRYLASAIVTSNACARSTDERPTWTRYVPASTYHPGSSLRVDDGAKSAPTEPSAASPPVPASAGSARRQTLGASDHQRTRRWRRSPRSSPAHPRGSSRGAPARSASSGLIR